MCDFAAAGTDTHLLDRDPATVNAIIAAARRHRAEAIARMIGAAVTHCRITLVSLLGPLVGWQRYQLPAGMTHHRTPRST